MRPFCARMQWAQAVPDQLQTSSVEPRLGGSATGTGMTCGNWRRRRAPPFPRTRWRIIDPANGGIIVEGRVTDDDDDDDDV